MAAVPICWHKNVDLSSRNTLAAPSVAAYFFEVVSERDLAEQVAIANSLAIPVFVLSGGSNVLCPPFIDGLVIVPAMLGIEVRSQGDEVYITVAAGEPWHPFVEHCLVNGWYGLENLALIPGLCGAAPIQNIGAYGVELADVLVSVRFFDRELEHFDELLNERCEFGYRESIFKKALRDRAVITAMTLKLTKKPITNTTYGPLQTLFIETPATPRALFEAVCDLRRSKLPDPKSVPNAGSFFKNPLLSDSQFVALKAEFPQMPHFPVSEGYVKVPAAWLIDQAGFKGEDVGELKVHSEQALVLTNPKRAPLSAVLEAANRIVKSVHDKFGVALEREPQVLGQR